MRSLEDAYRFRFDKTLVPTAARLEELLKEYFSGLARIDRITVRPKGVQRFVTKAEKRKEDGSQKYSDPLKQIQDQIGARIVTYYTPDVEKITERVRKYFRFVEQQLIVPESEKSFGYVGMHFILYLPDDVIEGASGEAPQFFELQVKTLFQHAWSEAEHDLNYKTSKPLTADQKRSIAFTAAQAWGADKIFSELLLDTERQEAANDAG